MLTTWRLSGQYASLPFPNQQWLSSNYYVRLATIWSSFQRVLPRLVGYTLVLLSTPTLHLGYPYLPTASFWSQSSIYVYNAVGCWIRASYGHRLRVSVWFSLMLSVTILMPFHQHKHNMEHNCSFLTNFPTRIYAR